MILALFFFFFGYIYSRQKERLHVGMPKVTWVSTKAVHKRLFPGQILHTFQETYYIKLRNLGFMEKSVGLAGTKTLFICGRICSQKFLFTVRLRHILQLWPKSVH